MSLRPTRPRFARAGIAAAMASAMGLAFTLAACGSTDEGETPQAGSIDCAPYTKFGDLKGKSVSFYTTIVQPEDAAYIESFKPFEQCTGATIKYEGDKAMETQILVRARAYGESRIVCGVHNLSAVEAGRTNASALVAALHGSPQFRSNRFLGSKRRSSKMQRRKARLHRSKRSNRAR